MIFLVGKPGPRRDALRSLLNAMPELGAVTTADDGPSALLQIRDHAPALVFIAGGLPAGEAAQLIRQIKHASPRVRCFIVADQKSEQDLTRSAGADQVVSTDTPFADMRAIIQKVFENFP
jgi:DNA-binding NarL/FixJ family response regulator